MSTHVKESLLENLLRTLSLTLSLTHSLIFSSLLGLLPIYQPCPQPDSRQAAPDGRSASLTVTRQQAATIAIPQSPNTRPAATHLLARALPPPHPNRTICESAYDNGADHKRSGALFEMGSPATTLTFSHFWLRQREGSVE